MTQVSAARPEGLIETPLVPRPRAVQDHGATAASAATSSIAHTIAVAPEIAATERPRRGADRVRPWLGLVVASITVGALWAGGLGLSPVGMAGLIVLWPLCLAQSGFHRPRPVVETAGQEARRTLSAAGRLALICWFVALLPSLGWHVEVGATSVLALHVLGALALTLSLGQLTRALLPDTTAGLVLVGHPDDVAAALPELRAGGYLPVSACLTRPASRAVAADLADLNVRVGLGETARSVRSSGAGGLVILPGSDLGPDAVRQLQWQAAAEHVEAYVATALLDVHPTRTRAVNAGGLPLVHIAHPRFGGAARTAKHCIERIAAALLLVLLSPVLAVLAAMIRATSTGPALFRQGRVGHQGTSFTMLKFRSMRTDAEQVRADLTDLDEGTGLLFKIREDPRVTPLGRWMRKFSVDELPQLWNVVRGEMSLVGPRPALPCEVQNYGFAPRRRLAVRPGLTGLWQVSGRSDLTWEESVRLDVRYVDNWSLRLDLWILARTFRAVMGHRGAY